MRICRMVMEDAACDERELGSSDAHALHRRCRHNDGGVSEIVHVIKSGNVESDLQASAIIAKGL